MASLLRRGCCTRPVVLPAQNKDEQQPRGSTCLCLAGPKLVNAVGIVTCVVIKCGEIVWQGTCNVEAPQPLLRFTLDAARWRPGMHECHVFVRSPDLQPGQECRPEEGWQHIEETHLLVLPVDAAEEVDTLFEGMLADVRPYFQHYSGKQHVLSLLKGLLRHVPFLSSFGAGSGPADPLAAADSSGEALGPMYLYTYEHCFVPFLTCWRTAMPEGRLYNEEAMYDSVRQLMEYLIEHNMFSCLVLLISRAPALALRALQEGLAHMDSLDVSRCGALRALAQQATSGAPTAAAAAAGGGTGGPEASTTTLSSPSSSSSERSGGSSMLADSGTSMESAAELLHMLAELELAHQVADRDAALLLQQRQQLQEHLQQQQQIPAAQFGAADSQYDPATNTALFETLEPNPGRFNLQLPAGIAALQGAHGPPGPGTGLAPGLAAQQQALGGAAYQQQQQQPLEQIQPHHHQQQQPLEQIQQHIQQLLGQMQQQRQQTQQQQQIQQQQAAAAPVLPQPSPGQAAFVQAPPGSSTPCLATVLATAQQAAPPLRGPFTAAAARHVQLVHLRLTRRHRDLRSSSGSSSGSGSSSRWTTLRGWVSAAAAAGPPGGASTVGGSGSQRSSYGSSGSEGEREGADTRRQQALLARVAEAGDCTAGGSSSSSSTDVMHLLRTAAGQLMGNSSSSRRAGWRVSPGAAAATTAVAAAHASAQAAAATAAEAASSGSKGGVLGGAWGPAAAAAAAGDGSVGNCSAAASPQGMQVHTSSSSSSSRGWHRWCGCSRADLAAAVRGFSDPHLEQSYAVFKNHSCGALDTTAFIICGGMLLASALRNFTPGGSDAWGKLQVLGLYGALFFFPYVVMLVAATAFLRHREALLAAARGASSALLIVMAWGWVPQPDAWVIAVSQTYSMQLQNAFILPACQQVRLRYELLVAAAHLIGDATLYAMAQPAGVALLTSALVQVTSLLVTLLLDVRCRATFLNRYQGPCAAAAAAAAAAVGAGVPPGVAVGVVAKKVA